MFFPSYKKRIHRGLSSERKLLGHLPPTIHTKAIQMLPFFDSIRRNISLGRKCPTVRWAIDGSKKHDKWTAYTLSEWLHEVASALYELPPEGFS
jgi:hypothetical protein